ncbi:hypothetical protein SAMN05216232_0864 [Virgibacillus subterraneus]|uniref:Cof-type HAD-IIB family hydrolase n=1 Tax=Virgibacillus subterraneus TaxID=621109 RepID=A0A1H9ANE9_9BACI|nr:Cof-type HAD-IIB family hydrolase [Virgibacillus subterraneus]SEP78071.1 hypothetical protein SAMN05216232_0864 [Virgibacillus subterraneus]
MNKKLIFFDIDGTLLDHNKQLQATAKKAIAELKRKGHIVAAATGRAPFTFKPILEELDIDTHVSMNGQYVVFENEAIYKNPLSSNVLQELNNFAATKNHPIIYVNHEDWYSNTENHPLVKRAIDSLKVDQELTYNPKFHHSGEVYQALLFTPEESEQDYWEAFKQQLEFIRWHEHSIDVLPHGGSKAAGIEKLIDHLQIPADDVYAFGDGLNDIKMLQSVRNSIAMGNASDVVKESAKIVTKDVQDDGILHGLRMVGLIKS